MFKLLWINKNPSSHHHNRLPQMYKSSNLQPPIEQGTENLIQLFPNGKLCANNAASNFQWKNQTQEPTIIFDNQICFPIFLCLSLDKYSRNKWMKYMRLAHCWDFCLNNDCFYFEPYLFRTVLLKKKTKKKPLNKPSSNITEHQRSVVMQFLFSPANFL